MYDFGLRLRELRKSRGLTQKMLAERINKSVSAVSSYESNVQLPPLDVSKSIALALGISIDYLVGNEATPAYTAKDLTEPQAELLDELISEFRCPTNRSPQLSEQQLQILKKLITVFTDVNRHVFIINLQKDSARLSLAESFCAFSGIDILFVTKKTSFVRDLLKHILIFV